MKILRLANTLNSTSAPYNQFTLGFKNEFQQTFCSLYENEVTLDEKIIGHHNNGSILRMLRLLKSLIKKNDYDVIHIHSGVTGIIFILALFPLNMHLLRKTVFTLHNSWNVLKTRNQLLNFIVMLCSQKVCTCGISSRNSIPKFIDFFINKKTSPIVNGFDHNRIDNVQFKNPKSSHFDQNSNLKIVCVGALNNTKNQIALLEALKVMKLDAEVIFLGDGINKVRLIEFSKTISDSTNISFQGRVSRDLAIEFMLEADISISLSTGEGLPIAVLESIYAGCYSILSSIPPHLEISPPKERCYFVNPFDQSEIIDSLTYAQKNIEDIRSSRDLSKEHAVKNFSVERMLGEYHGVYDWLIHKR